MKNILVASDLSERSRPAVRRAVNLAADVGARLTVLHVLDEAIPDNLSQQVQVGAKTILSEQVAEDAGDRSIASEVTVVIGDAVETINEIIDKSDADLLIVGLHRRRRFLDQIRETTMEHLIRSSRIPVLLVAGDGAKPYADVLSGVDLSKVCAAALYRIPMVAPTGNLTLFHAHEASFSKEARRDYQTWKAMFPLPEGLPAPQFYEAAAGDALREMLDRKSYDLLAIGGHTRSNAGRYILGSFTSGLIRNPPCDLLVAK